MPDILVEGSASPDGNGGINLSAQPVITPTGTSTPLPLSPEVGWHIDLSVGNNSVDDLGGGNDSKIPNPKEEVVKGLGVSLEMAFPKAVIDYTAYGVGLDFGVVEDSNGFSFYATTKYTLESGFSGGISVEGFRGYKTDYNQGVFDRYSLRGDGFEASGGLGPVGVSYGTDGMSLRHKNPNFYIWTFSLGVGSPAEYANWRTNTHVSGNR